MKPMEIEGLEITEADGKEFEVKNPGRFVRDTLNRFLHKSGLETDYRVMWRAMANGNTYVGVVFEPPVVEHSRTSRQKKEA